MKYIIMCGGEYAIWDKPRQLTEINGEPLVARTIRQLRENRVSSVAISSQDPVFDQFGVPVLKHDNKFTVRGYNDSDGYWCDAFYPMDDPVCYIFGDVVFTDDAIKTIVETETEDIEFFASAPPFHPDYPKKWAEPFALKVIDTERLHHAIEQVKKYDKEGKFWRVPIMWELWNVITAGDLNRIDYGSYFVINDATCDIDQPGDEAWQMDRKT